MASTGPTADSREPLTGGDSARSQQTRMLLFSAAGRTFAVAAEQVREVVPFRRPTRLPGAPSHVAGILNLRGTVVTVIDLARRLGIAEPPSGDRCIVLLSRNGRAVGLTVDSVRDVVAVDESTVERSEGEQGFSELATGILRLDSELILMLDVQLLVRQVLLT